MMTSEGTFKTVRCHSAVIEEARRRNAGRGAEALQVKGGL